MKFHNSEAEIFVPDGLPVQDALARTTHLAIGAHPDDLEIIAVDGILACFQRSDRWFTGVVVTDGAGSPRGGLYRDATVDEMRSIRAAEQKKAAVMGGYGAQVLLAYPSAVIKDGTNRHPVRDLEQVLHAARPEVVYTHSLADRHPTHVGVALRAIAALRALPPGLHPKRVYGCEAWRSLDWLVDLDRVAFDCSAREDLQAALLGVFDSQIGGGKRYDLATMGRRRAHATYAEPHEVDAATGLAYAMDLTPLILDPTLDIVDYVQAHIDRFAADVRRVVAALK
jgi:LmbE family N-acetylglucosaminyl deacetylase